VEATRSQSAKLQNRSRGQQTVMASRQELPADVAAAFDRAPEAGARFAELPPDQQADWLNWIEQGRGGKRGRAARIDEAVRRLLPTATAAQEEVVEPAGPPPERYWWVWLLVLLLLVVGGLLAWYLLTRGDDKSTVPNVIGLRSQVAADRIHDRDLEVLPRTGQSNRPSGVVFAQKPGAGTQLGEGQTVTISISSGRLAVPDVTGRPLKTAQAQLTSAGFNSEVRRVASTRPKGIVLDQAPVGGVTAVRGTTVKLSVSSGVKPVLVPRLIGQTQGAAVSTLTRLGLRATLRNVPSDQPAGLVVAQNPPAGNEVDKGSAVIVNISSGTGGQSTTTVSTTTVASTTTAAARVPVPTVRGLAVTTGLRRLNTAEFRPVVRYVASTQPAGRIVFQAPAGGGTAPGGSRVRVNVSTGPSPASAVSVPDVVGQDQASAATALRQAGFRVLVLNRRTSDQAQDGLVVEQQPGAGASIPRGSYVAIFIGRSG
jgi:beta-lactam-binding protein with PASTA domain